MYDDQNNSLIFMGKDGKVENIPADQIKTNAEQNGPGVIAEFIRSMEENRQPFVSGRSVFPIKRRVFAFGTWRSGKYPKKFCCLAFFCSGEPSSLVNFVFRKMNAKVSRHAGNNL